MLNDILTPEITLYVGVLLTVLAYMAGAVAYSFERAKLWPAVVSISKTMTVMATLFSAVLLVMTAIRDWNPMFGVAISMGIAAAVVGILAMIVVGGLRASMRWTGKAASTDTTPPAAGDAVA